MVPDPIGRLSVALTKLCDAQNSGFYGSVGAWVVYGSVSVSDIGSGQWLSQELSCLPRAIPRKPSERLFIRCVHENKKSKAPN